MKATRTRAKTRKYNRAIFPDTKLFSKRNDALSSYLNSYKSKRDTLDSYKALATKTLREAGIDPTDLLGLEMLLDDPALDAQVYESMQLLEFHRRFLALRLDFINTTATLFEGKLDSRATNKREAQLLKLNVWLFDLSMNIGALGERIKARDLELAAFEGSGRMRRYEKGRETIARNRKITRLRFLKLYRDDRQRASAAGSKKSKSKSIKDALEMYAKLYPNSNPEKKAHPSESAAHVWVSPRRK